MIAPIRRLTDRPESNRTRRLIGISCIFAMCLLAAFVPVARSDHRTIVAAPRLFAVYYQSPTIPTDERLDQSKLVEALQDQSVAFTSDITEFINLLTSTSPQSIWIHTEKLDDVPTDLLRTQARQGTVIVAINVTSGELAAKLGAEASRSPDFKPEGYTTYVVMAEAIDVPYTNELGMQATRSTIVRRNDIILPQDPGPLVWMVQDVVGEIRETLGGTR